FEVEFTGKFNAPVAGTYNFDTGSDDGSMIWIDGNQVVSNNAFQPVTVKSGSANLTAGLHDIVIAFYQGTGGWGLYADVQVPGGTLQRIPNSMLSGSGPTNFQIGSLSGGGTFALGSSSLTIGGGANNGVFTGAFSATSQITVTKVGANSQ